MSLFSFHQGHRLTLAKDWSIDALRCKFKNKCVFQLISSLMEQVSGKFIQEMATFRIPERFLSSTVLTHEEGILWRNIIPCYAHLRSAWVFCNKKTAFPFQKTRCCPIRIWYDALTAFVLSLWLDRWFMVDNQSDRIMTLWIDVSSYDWQVLPRISWFMGGMVLTRNIAAYLKTK